MFSKKKKLIESLEKDKKELSNVLNALHRSLAVIEFDLSGNILSANANFCDALGYSFSEIEGKHHSLFVTPEFKASQAYSQFWSDLGNGKFSSGQFLRIGKGGKEVWIEATYNPIYDDTGAPYKVVKLASDITEKVKVEQDVQAKLMAIDRSYAIIEFSVDGRIICANENFLNVVGYGLDEIVGKHHRMFVDPQDLEGGDYQRFWDELAEGKDHVSVFKRLKKNGDEVWIQAAYIPVPNGSKRPTKVIKVAADITEQKKQELNLSIMDEVVVVLQALAKGDLTKRIGGVYEGDLAALKGHVNASVGNLSAALEQISESVEHVTRSSVEVSSSAENLSGQLKGTAGSVEQTLLAMVEAVSIVSETQNKVSEASVSTKEQQAFIDIGTELMTDTLNAIEQIKHSSEQITNIVTLIDGIAFQTNLLALNAAVEAARAGDHGRGFAVVAGEVRALAGKSADAAKDIKALIKQAVTESQNGVNVVSKLSDNLCLIRNKSNDVNDIIAHVGDLAEQQSLSVETITREIKNIESSTEQNTVFVHETEEGAANAAEQANAVKSIVSQFKIAKPENAY